MIDLLPQNMQQRIHVVADVSTYPGPCWIWTGFTNEQGYGITSLNGRLGPKTGIHRAVWTLVVSDIPPGLVLDHLCRVRSCCNPAHLEPVTQGENVRRGEQANRTHCPYGHEYTTANTMIQSRGSRACRTCNNQRQRMYHALNRDRLNIARKARYRNDRG